MNPEEIKNFLKRITYKPGFRIEYVGDDFGRYTGMPGYTMHRFYIINEGVDSDNTGKFIKLTKAFMMTDEMCQDETVFFRLIRSEIIAWELHEADEFLKLDGEAPYHPHKQVC